MFLFTCSLCNSTLILFTCFIDAFLVKIGKDIPESNIADCYSLKDCLASIINKEASNILVIIKNRIKDYIDFFM